MDDIHGNLYAPRWYPKAFQYSMARDYLRRRNKEIDDSSIENTLSALNRMLTDCDGKRTLSAMDAAGIASRVIVILDFGLELGEADASVEEINSEILEICARSERRLIGFCGVDPRRKNAIALVKDAFRLHGAKGLKLHPTADWSLLDDVCQDLVSVSASYGAPVLAHLGKTIDILSDANAEPEAFVELARRFPASQFVAGHCGFYLWESFVRQKESVPRNMFFDIAGWQEMYPGKPEKLAYALAELSEAFPGRICFGTDAPFYGYNVPLIEKKWLEFVKTNIKCQLVQWDHDTGRLREGI